MPLNWGNTTGQVDPGSIYPGQVDPGQVDPGQAVPGQWAQVVGQDILAAGSLIGKTKEVLAGVSRGMDMDYDQMVRLYNQLSDLNEQIATHIVNMQQSTGQLRQEVVEFTSYINSQCPEVDGFTQALAKATNTATDPSGPSLVQNLKALHAIVYVYMGKVKKAIDDYLDAEHRVIESMAKATRPKS